MHECHSGSPGCSDVSDLLDQSRRDALPAMWCRNGKIVDVDLAALLLELLQLITREASQNGVALNSGDGYEALASEKVLEVGARRPRVALGRDAVEGLSEHLVEGLHQLDVGPSKHADRERRGCHTPVTPD